MGNRDHHELCEAFESAWRDGKPQRIEDVLETADPSIHSILLCELVKLEIDLRKLPDYLAAAPEYYARFPENTAAVEQAIRELMRRLGESLPPKDRKLRREFQRGEGIGRYVVVRQLGHGKFGVVYLADDPQLRRSVAIKVPRFEEEASPSQRHGGNATPDFLAEARNVVPFRHPGIVTVHEVNLQEGMPYIVQEYLPGGDLSRLVAQAPLDCRMAAKLVLQIADALRQPHAGKLYHLDLKPSNILLDGEGRPCIADFGLAMRGSTLMQLPGRLCGSPPYMAPEQIRAETNRINQRTDLWSLGVILYELLTGARPFDGDMATLSARIQANHPAPPRQINPAIPPELQRICLTCLAKKPSHRHRDAQHLIDELQAWLDRQGETPAVHPEHIQVQPRGLRPFTAEDAEAYLQLIPGPRSSAGMPTALQFWLSKIGCRDPLETFAVGLIYGPSGSGKSSFITAGIVPRLDERVQVVFVEATANETELRLLKKLRQIAPQFGSDIDLPDMLRLLREGDNLRDGQKILIVIDQFEQWLHANPNLDQSQLVAALRQCDGAKLQCVVLVRDDFWMGITRFMQALEIEIVRLENADVVDRFELSHARKVLQLFGEGYGISFSDDPGIREAQEEFLDAAVEKLATDDRVISIHLALFAEMMKEKPWRPQTLKARSPAEIGVAYLEDTFHSARAIPSHRAHAYAARKVLERLLPETEADAGPAIKGYMVSVSALHQASGYAESPKQFEDLLNLLNLELRLITPTDPVSGPLGDELFPSDALQKTMREPYFQLTHDFLVPSVRAWIHGLQMQTRQGRAALRLQERTRLWTARQETQQLPSTPELISIWTGTSAADRTPQQQRMLWAAVRARARGWVAAIVVVGAVVWGGFAVWDYARTNAAHGFINSLVDAPAEQVPFETERLADYADVALPELRERFTLAEPGSRAQLNLAFAIATVDKPDVNFLIQQIEMANANQAPNFAAALKDHHAAVLELWSKLDSSPGASCCAAVLLELGDARGLTEIARPAHNPDRRTEFLLRAPSWNLRLPQLVELLQELQKPDSPQVSDLKSLGFSDREIAQAQAALCEIIGGIDAEMVSTTDLQLGLQEIHRLAQTTKFGCVHVFACWALKQHGIAPPNIASTSGPLDGADWFVNEEGITMTAIPDVKGTPAFYMSTTEVTVRQFQRFVAYVRANPNDPLAKQLRELSNENRPVPRKSPYLNCPIQGVLREEAMAFCNWLSFRDGLKPFYLLGNDGKWTPDIDAPGYRLPSVTEWQAAYRAGTETSYFFGENADAYLREYAVVFSKETEAVGSRRPNPLGLFDMTGNLTEWVFNLSSPQETLRSCGGTYSQSQEQQIGDHTFNFGTEPARSNINGFRVVRPLTNDRNSNES